MSSGSEYWLRPGLDRVSEPVPESQRIAHAAKLLLTHRGFDGRTLFQRDVVDVVKRVLARMTDEAVHRVVLDAAERIIREEIDRLKSPSNTSGH